MRESDWPGLEEHLPRRLEPLILAEPLEILPPRSSACLPLGCALFGGAAFALGFLLAWILAGRS